MREKSAQLLSVDLCVSRLSEHTSGLEDSLDKILLLPADDTRAFMEHAVLLRGLDNIEQSVEALIKSLCLLVAGSLPDSKGWYDAALEHLTGDETGRALLLSPELRDLLIQAKLPPECDSALALVDKLSFQRRRKQIMIGAADALLLHLSTLDTQILQAPLKFSGSVIPAFVAQHEERHGKAKARLAALKNAFVEFEEVALEGGYSVVSFGSYAEGRVHGQSDLDIVVLGEVPLDAQEWLRAQAQPIEKLHGVPIDLHFEANYSSEFLDRMKVICDGGIITLRQHVQEARDAAKNAP